MWSNKYIHIPFKDGGRAIEGSDCWGLTRIIYEKELGVTLPLFTGYENTKDVKSISKMVKESTSGEQWMLVDEGCEKEFDVCVFKIIGQASHVGIVVEKGLMIHCQRGVGTSHCDYKKDGEWSKRLQGIYRYAKHPDLSNTL